MTLLDILKFFKPSTLEAKAFLSQIPVAVIASILDNNYNLLVLPLPAITPLYAGLRLERLREHLGNIRFDNQPKEMSKEEFERHLKKPTTTKEVPPNLYLDSVRTLYHLR